MVLIRPAIDGGMWEELTLTILTSEPGCAAVDPRMGRRVLVNIYGPRTLFADAAQTRKNVREKVDVLSRHTFPYTIRIDACFAMIIQSTRMSLAAL